MSDAGKTETPQKISMEFHLPANLAVLGGIRRRLVQLAREYHISEADIAKIEISVDEACTNVMKHAYCPELPQETAHAGALIVIMRILADRVEIEVIDQGIGKGDGPHQGIANLEEYQRQEVHAGLGLYIIDKCMDEYQVAFPAQAGTHLSMVKYIERTT